MSLTADLLFHNFPPPPSTPRTPKNKQEKAAQHPNHIRANYKRRTEAIARYKAVMGNDWWTPRQLGETLGIDRNVPNKVLARWHKLDLVDRRKVGSGYEWRIK